MQTTLKLPAPSSDLFMLVNISQGKAKYSFTLPARTTFKKGSIFIFCCSYQIRHIIFHNSIHPRDEISSESDTLSRIPSRANRTWRTREILECVARVEISGITVMNNKWAQLHFPSKCTSRASSLFAIQAACASPYAPSNSLFIMRQLFDHFEVVSSEKCQISN
jgi:hypothetical protein